MTKPRSSRQFAGALIAVVCLTLVAWASAARAEDAEGSDAGDAATASDARAGDAGADAAARDAAPSGADAGARRPKRPGIESGRVPYHEKGCSAAPGHPSRMSSLVFVAMAALLLGLTRSRWSTSLPWQQHLRRNGC